MFNYKWYLKDGFPSSSIEKNNLNVFSCFACGGGKDLINILSVVLYRYIIITGELMNEVWKDIKEYANYQISNFGNVRSKRYMRNIKPIDNGTGYKKVQIGSSKNKKYIHRLVAKMFIDNPLNKLVVNHKDGNKANNIVENLEWMTRSENDLHKYKIGLATPKKGISHHNSKLIDSDTIEIKSMLKSFNCVEIAKKFNVHRKTISDIKNNKTWKHINDGSSIKSNQQTMV